MADVEVTRPSYYHPKGKIGSRFGGRNKSNEKESAKCGERKPTPASPVPQSRPSAPLSLAAVATAAPVTTAAALAGHPAMQPRLPTHHRRSSIPGNNTREVPREDQPHRQSHQPQTHQQRSFHATPQQRHPFPQQQQQQQQQHQNLHPIRMSVHPQEQGYHPHGSNHRANSHCGAPNLYPMHQHQQQQHLHQSYGNTTVRMSMGESQRGVSHPSVQAGGAPHHYATGCGTRRVDQQYQALDDPMRHSYHGSTGHSGSIQQQQPNVFLSPYHNQQQQQQQQQQQLHQQYPGASYRNQPLRREDLSISLRSCDTGGPVVTRPVYYRDDSQSSFCDDDAMSRSSRSCHVKHPMESYHRHGSSGGRMLPRDQGLQLQGYTASIDPLRHSYHGCGDSSNSTGLRTRDERTLPLSYHDSSGHIPPPQSREVYRHDSNQSSRSNQTNGSTRTAHRGSQEPLSLLGVLDHGNRRSVGANYRYTESMMDDHSQRSERSAREGRRHLNGTSLLSHVNDNTDGVGHVDYNDSDSFSQSQPKRHIYARSTSDPYEGRPPDRMTRHGTFGADERMASLGNQGSVSPTKSRNAGQPNVNSEGIRARPGNQGPASPQKHPNNMCRPSVVDSEGIRVRPANQGPASPQKHPNNRCRPSDADEGIEGRPGNQGPASPHKHPNNKYRPSVVDGEGIQCHPGNQKPASPQKHPNIVCRPSVVDNDAIQRRPGNHGQPSPQKYSSSMCRPAAVDGESIRVRPSMDSPRKGRSMLDSNGVRSRPANPGPASPQKNQTNTGSSTMDNDGFRVRPEVISPVRKSQNDKVRATMECHSATVRPSGPKRTDSYMQSAGIYPEVIRSPKRDAGPRVVKASLPPFIPLDIDEGIGVNPVIDDSVQGMGSTLSQKQHCQPRPRMAATASDPVSQTGRSIQRNIQARPLDESNSGMCSPITTSDDSASTSDSSGSDELKRMRLQRSGGRLMNSTNNTVKIEGMAVLLDQSDSQTSPTRTRSPPQPERPRVWV